MKRALIAGFVVVVLAIVLVGWSMFGDHSSFEAGLASYEGLPAGASDIVVYRNRNISGVFLADFKIQEPEFVAFAKGKQWQLQPISESTFVFQARAFHEGRPNDKKAIADGLYYSLRASNGGGVTAAYDRSDGRAYIDSSSR